MAAEFVAAQSQRLLLGDISANIPINGPATIEWWMTLTRLASVRGAIQQTHTQIYQHSANDFLYLNGGGADYFAVGATLKAGVPYHFALTYNGTHETTKLYVNGTSYPITIQTPSTSHALLNSMYVAGFADMIVDNLRIYSRVLSPDEVVAAYLDSTTPPQRKNLEAEWLIDDVSMANGAPVRDTSGNNHTGTYSQGATRRPDIALVNGGSFTGGWYLAEKGHIAPPPPPKPRARKPSAAEIAAKEQARLVGERQAELAAAEAARVAKARKLWGNDSPEPSYVRLPNAQPRDRGPKNVKLPKRR